MSLIRRRRRSTVDEEDTYVRTRMRANGKRAHGDANCTFSETASTGLGKLHARKHLGRIRGAKELTVDLEDAYIRRRLRKDNNPGHGSDNARATPAPVNGKPTPSSRGSLTPLDRIRRIVLGYLGVLLGVILFFGSAELRVGGGSAILPVNDSDMRSSIDAMVQYVRVTGSHEIDADDLIAALADGESRAELQKMLARIQELRARFAMLKVGLSKEDSDVVKEETANLEAQQHRLNDILQRLELLAHHVVQEGSPDANGYDLKKLVAEIAVPEHDMADVKVGQTVQFKAWVYPDDTFYGTVTATATTAQTGSSDATSIPPLSVLSSSTSDGATVLVSTVIDNSSLRLKPGMSGYATIVCGERTCFDLLMRRLERVFEMK